MGRGGADQAAPSAVTAAHRDAWRRTLAQPIGGGPTERGFDRYFGTDVPNWPPYCFIDGDRTVGIPTTVSCGLKRLPAVRDGSWKLILGRGSGGWSPGGDAGPRVQLYDLAVDPGETRNVAADHPQRVAALTGVYQRLVDDGRSTPGPALRNDTAVQPFPVAR